MFQALAKKFAILVLLISIFNLSADFPALFPVLRDSLANKNGNIVDKIYLAKLNPNVVDNFRIGIREAQAALDEGELEYAIDVGPVNGSTSANYVYAAFFNPSGSGRTAVLKRIAVRANAVGAANYVNLSVRRISAASAGTQVAATDIPKKNTGSFNPITVVRHTGVTVTFIQATQSRLMGQAMPGAAGQWHSYRDITFGANDEKIILQQGEGIALYQEAAGNANERIRIYVEWEEVASPPSAQGEYLLAIQRVENAAAANYVYNSFFNPAASGKTAIVKRIWFGSETCDTTAVYTNNIIIKRISAASGGTQITGANVPKKHTGSANSIMDVRYTGVTVTQVGGTDARLGMITPCGAAGQPHGWMQIDFHSNDEKLILQQGEGIALISEATGDLDQINRMIIEWQEIASGSTPASQGEYLFAFPRITPAAAPAANTTLYTFFNPSGSGRTAVVKRLVIRNNTAGTGTYAAFQFRRITAASNGVLVSASDIPKKHTGTGNSIIEARYCGTTCATAITATYSGTTDSDLMQTNGPSVIGQVIGQREIVFGDNEKLVLQQGEGVGLYLDVLAGATTQYYKILVEWDEEVSAPSSQGEYLIDIGPINGNTGTSYNYASFFNPAASGKTAIIKRVSVRVDSIAAAVYIPMRLRRTTAASAGTQITAANIPKKHTGTSNSAMEIRRTGVTITYAQSADAQLIGVQTAGAAGSAIAPSLTGYRELLFANDERIILQPGQGVALHHDTAAGDADFRVKLLIEWEEVASGSTPASEGEYLMTVGPVNGSLNSGYVYASLFNPAGSGKNYVVKRIGIRSNRSGTLVAPGYIPATIRKTTAASDGTQVTVGNVPKKHTGTSDTTAEIRHTGVTATFAQDTASRLLGVTVPGAVNQFSGDFESEIVFGDELILKPGEGIALYQEAAAGDALIRFRFNFQWSESDIGGFSTAIEIRAQNYTSAVSTITFPEGAPGSVISQPYNNVDGAGNPQVFGGAGTAKPVVTLYNGSGGSLIIWYNITTFTNSIVSSESYLVNNKGAACTDANCITGSVTFDTDTTTGVTIVNGAGNEKDFYLKITLSAVAAKTGNSTLTILGETP